MAVEYVPKEQAEMEFMALMKFLALTGEERKRRGIKKAASKHKEELFYVQGVARFVGRHKEIVTIEDVRNAVEGAGKKWTLACAAGAVFQGKDWQWMGFVRAKRPEAHARVIKTWRLKK